MQLSANPGTRGAERSQAPFNADDTLEYVDSETRRLFVRVVSIAGLLAYAGYLLYRALYTFNRASPIFSLAVYLAELHGFLCLCFFVHEVWALRRRRVLPPQDQLNVDVFITTYNEDLDLLRQTVRGALAIRYPHRTFVLDDGRRPAVRRPTNQRNSRLYSSCSISMRSLRTE
jgi:cellulose synthase (UDP-forming)